MLIALSMINVFTKQTSFSYTTLLIDSIKYFVSYGRDEFKSLVTY